MPKRVLEELPEADWTSLIDIIFQLLIFFMVTLALGTVQQKATSKMEGEEKANLPELPGMTNLGEALDISSGMILMHVAQDPEDKVRGDLMVYLLDDKFPTVKDAEQDSLHRAGPFSWEEAYSKLEDQITFAREMFEPLPRVEMRAYQGTPYGKVLDVMKLCYHDDEELRIDQVYFRFARLSKQERGGGS